jgi:hypothetical protein
MYGMPELYNTHNYLKAVPHVEIQICKSECIFRHTCPCDEDVRDLCVIFMREDNIDWPSDPYEGIHVYLFLRDSIRQNM